MNVSDTVDSPHSTSGLTNALPSASLIEHDSDSVDGQEDDDGLINEEPVDAMGFEDYEIIVDNEAMAEMDETILQAELEGMLRYNIQRSFDNSNLPSTVSVLSGNNGELVYLVGTAHFSRESCDDVQKVVSMVHPDAVVVELCRSRSSILTLNESYIEEIKKMSSLERLRSCIRSKGVLSGIVVFLMHETSNNITTQLKMAPGEEMRTAFEEAKKIPGTTFLLGDRSFPITMRRMLSKLTTKDKVVLGWRMVRDVFGSVSPEEIEEMKNKDVFEKLFAELSEEFPTLAQVLLKERDIYLASFLKEAVQQRVLMPNGESRPPVVVAVVGIGHKAGIIEHFGKTFDSKQMLRSLEIIPENSESSRVLLYMVRLSVFGMTAYTCFKLVKWIGVFR